MQYATGWIPPMPDMGDYSDASPEVAPLLSGLKMDGAPPAVVDLRKWFSPVENQGQLGSCTAHAAIGIVEYFQRRAFGRHTEGSRLFVYKATRDLAGMQGDSGAYLRNAMGALALVGVPPEKYWPYTDSKVKFDATPPPLVYAVADSFEALKYFCHDPFGANRTGEQTLASVKKYLAAGIPAMFGFYGFPSFEDGGHGPGQIPFPGPREKAAWGHAVVAAGYDDQKIITGKKTGIKTTGALLIRNSWGESWGERGYGWLPYDYVTRQLAEDFWSLIAAGYVETGQFGF